jgi:hypothetical protein
MDVVTLRTGSLAEDGLMIASHERNERPAFAPLPPFVAELVRARFIQRAASISLDRHFDHQDRSQRLVGENAAPLCGNRNRRKAIASEIGLNEPSFALASIPGRPDARIHR